MLWGSILVFYVIAVSNCFCGICYRIKKKLNKTKFENNGFQKFENNGFQKFEKVTIFRNLKNNGF